MGLFCAPSSVKANVNPKKDWLSSALHIRFLLIHCIRAPPRRGRYWEIHPRRPKDFPRPERFPEGEAQGKSQGSREIWRAEGMDFPIPPEFWWSTDNLSASIFLQGVDQKILPCGQGRIDSVKINPSLLMMTDCAMPRKKKEKKKLCLVEGPHLNQARRALS